MPKPASELPPLTDSRIQSFCLVILTAVAIAFALYFLRPVLVPFTLALFTAIVLAPVVDWLVHHARLPRLLALITAMLLVLGLLLLLGTIIAISIAGLTADEDAYGDRVGKLITRGAGWLDDISVPLTERIPGLDTAAITEDVGEQVTVFVQKGVMDLGKGILLLVSQGVLVLIFVFFLMLGRVTRQEPVGGIWGEVQGPVKRYLIAKLLVSGVTGTLVGITLAILGVDLALTFGFLAFALNFIPNIGSLVATLLPLPVVLLAPEPSAVTIVLALAIPGTIQFVAGNVVEPKLLGKSLDLHPVMILISLMFFAMIWGIAGMLFAVPITAIIKIVLARLELTHPFAELMAGRMANARPCPEGASQGESDGQ